MRQEVSQRQEAGLYLLAERAQLLEMPEDEFARFIGEVERSPLFIRLYHKDRIIRRQRQPGADISRRVFDNEPVVADIGSFSAEELLAGRDELAQLVLRIGPEDFKRYFLYAETELNVSDIASACGLTVDEVGRINRLIDDFSVSAEFYHPSSVNDEVLHYTRVASVERGPDGFIVGYYSPGNARGRYVIDYGKLTNLKETGAYTEAEAREMRTLLRRLEMINQRRDTLFRILEMVIARQNLYLESGDAKSLLPLSQKEVAQKTGLAASSVSRCIAARSVDTPWGEMPLKEFFPRPRRFRRDLVARMIAAEERPMSDEALRRRLNERFGVVVSRREVASLRRDLKIAGSWKRQPVRRAA
jgi:transposase